MRHQATKTIKATKATRRFLVPSTSHEYHVLSWWAAKESGATNTQMVDEESEHRPVWGLSSSSGHVIVPWKNGQELRVEVVDKGDVIGTNSMPEQLEVISVQCPDAVSIDAVLGEARKMYGDYFTRRGLHVFYTRKNGERVSWRDFGTLPGRTIQSVSLVDGMEQDLLNDARRFLEEEDVYDRAGRPYKRVYCLHGPPGTGKTSTVIAIATELGKDLAIFNVDSLRDDTFIELMSDLPHGAVVMFEDVDAMFKSRESKAGGMTFSTLLNSLDGVLHPRGALLFLTTNHVDRLDSALHRPGRVDRLIEVGNSTAAQRSLMWSAVFPQTDVPDILLKVNHDISPAWLSAILFQHRGATADKVISALVSGLRVSPSGRRQKSGER